MKNTILLFSLLFVVSIFSSAIADETYFCTFGQHERVISIIYQNQTTKLPCEVRYQRDGVTDVLWTSKNEAGFCESKAEEFLKKQLSWGWRCNDSKMPAGINADALQKTVEDPSHKYKVAAGFAQMLSIMTPLKTMATQHYLSEGKFPSSLSEIGLNPKDMKSSKHVSDLTLKGNGEIYAKGNKFLGEKTVVRLKPRQALGGLSMEWDCASNIKVQGFGQCSYQKDLKFPN